MSPRRFRWALFGLALVGIIPFVRLGRRTTIVTPRDAASHIGEEATVCGQVASVAFAQGTYREPTFLNLDKPYPDQIFTVVIWGEHRGVFTLPPEIAYRDQHICVTGHIRDYEGRPEVFVADPTQIRLVSVR